MEGVVIVQVISRNDRRPPGYLLFLVNDYKFPLTGILKVYFIISLLKINDIGFYAGVEGLSFLLTRQRLMFGFLPWKWKGSD